MYMYIYIYIYMYICVYTNSKHVKCINVEAYENMYVLIYK